VTRPSVAARLTRYAPSLRRAHGQYASAGATRAAMAQLQAQPAAYDPPRRMPSGVTVTPGRSPLGWPVHEVTPTGREPAAVVLLLHGGAYFRELKAQHWRFAGYLAREVGARVVVPVYPLAPAATAATVVPGVLALTTALLGSGSTQPVFLVGDSAGAGMALAVAQQLHELPGEGAGPAGLVLISPWVDVTCSDPRMAAVAERDPWLQAPGLRAAGEAYRGDLPTDHPWVSPITGPLADLPDLLVLSGTDDILTVDAERLVEAVTTAGGRAELVREPGQIHDYALHPTPEGRAARRRIAAWLRARLP
jgi:acetyl esterase/lipase